MIPKCNVKTQHVLERFQDSQSRETVKYVNGWNQESLCCLGPAAVHQISGLVWYHVTHDRAQWPAVVSTDMHFRMHTWREIVEQLSVYHHLKKDSPPTLQFVYPVLVLMSKDAHTYVYDPV
jgi:hypothetical protein